MAKEPVSREVLELSPAPSRRAERPRPHRPGGGEGEAGSLRETLAVLRAGGKTIILVAGGVLALAAAYLLLAAPVYEVDAVFRVEERTKDPTLLDERAARSMDRSLAENEIEVLRSRRLLGEVVDALELDVLARPRRFPVVGAALARRHVGAGPAPARLGLGRYAWGGERIRLSRLEVAPDLVGTPLLLTALGESRFRVAAEDGTPLAEGSVGALASGERLRIQVAELVARPGTGFLVQRQLRADVVADLQEALRAEEKGKKSGILVARMDGTDPAAAARTLQAISETYLRLNVEGRAAEAQRTLDFIEAQLPAQKASLDQAEAALSAHQTRKGTVGLSADAQALLARSADLDRELSALELRRAEARQRFTPEHPEVAALEDKAAGLRARRTAQEARLRSLPATELESVRLSRDVKVASELYLMLLSRAQEYRVIRSGVTASVSIIDPAQLPPRPARPKAALVLAFGLLLGVGAGVAAVLVRRAIATGPDDPDVIEAATGLSVLATIPHSARQDGLRRAARREPEARQRALAELAPDDAAVEHLRSLCSALQVALADASPQVIALSSPSPGAGKSFVCVNLAHLLAGMGRHVLLVDADLRRGRLHRYFGVAREPGLADILGESVAPADAIRETGVQNLRLLPSGRVPANPAELLGGPQLLRLLSSAERVVDLVIVDSPPVLAVADPALVARAAGITLLVLQAGHHPLREINQALKRFALCGVRVGGLVLNDVDSVAGRYGTYPRIYEYRSENARR